MSEGATNGPVPSKFVFLHEVASLPSATKVRLLGCVVQYDTTKGRLLLEHAYPKNAHPIPHIFVDTELVLESTPPSLYQQGSWINIIGYVRNPDLHNRKRRDNLSNGKSEIVSVQAILIWDAGALRTGDYEDILEEQRLAQRQLHIGRK